MLLIFQMQKNNASSLVVAASGFLFLGPPFPDAHEDLPQMVVPLLGVFRNERAF